MLRCITKVLSINEKKGKKTNKKNLEVQNTNMNNILAINKNIMRNEMVRLVIY